jgi:hypothetical protein
VKLILVLFHVRVKPNFCHVSQKMANGSLQKNAILYIKLKLWYVYVCVCIFAYSSRTDEPIFIKFGMLMPCHNKEILERSKVWKNVLSSSPFKGCSCSSETNYGRRTAPRPKLFRKRILQKQRRVPQKPVLCSSPVKMVTVARKLNTIEERRQDKSCFFRRGDYRNRGHNSEEVSWVRVPMKMVSVARQLSMIKERRQGQICLFRRGDYRNKGHNHENLSWVRVLVRWFL